MTDRKIEYWVIPPPKENGAFVAAMENVLETYKKPYDAEYPVVCMDEQPAVQLLDDVWEPIPETKNHPRRVDYEYERRGTASIFMFTEPFMGWRRADARERRTKLDWSEEVQGVLELYPNAKKLCDNLNTRVYGLRFVLRAISGGRGLFRFVNAWKFVTRQNTAVGGT